MWIESPRQQQVLMTYGAIVLMRQMVSPRAQLAKVKRQAKADETTSMNSRKPKLKYSSHALSCYPIYAMHRMPRIPGAAPAPVADNAPVKSHPRSILPGLSNIIK